MSHARLSSAVTTSLPHDCSKRACGELNSHGTGSPQRGQEFLVSYPQTTKKVTDVVGEQQGVQYWAGLRGVMDTLLEEFWVRVPWSRHSCDACRRTVEVDGLNVTVQTAALDGIRG